MTRDIFRQGDILLIPVKAIPAAIKPVDPENGRVVLAHGEVTGHHHSFVMAERIALFREDGSGGGLFLTVSGDTAPLTHQEHRTLDIPAGMHEVRRQREYHPAALRQVED